MLSPLFQTLHANPRKSAAIGLLVIAVGFGVRAYINHTPQEQQAGFATLTEAATVTEAPLVTTVTAVGTLIAQDGIIVRPEIAGRVSEILFKEGQVVDKGAPLIRLDDTIYKAQLAQAQAEKSLAESNYSRAQALVGRGAGTVQSRDENSARLRTATAALELAQANLDKTLISAPFKGTTGIRLVSLGDYVSPGQDVVSLQALDTLKVDFSVPETALAGLAVGQKVSLQVGAYPNETFSGEVSAIDPLIDPNTRSVKLRALVPNPDGKLRSGQFGSVTLTISQQDHVLFVPSAAIWPMGDKVFVFQIKDGMAALAPVTLLRRDADKVAVTGLAAGDMVATAAQAKLMMFGQGQPTPVKLATLDGKPVEEKPAAPAPETTKTEAPKAEATTAEPAAPQTPATETTPGEED